MEEKMIEDYLPFYIGCRVETITRIAQGEHKPFKKLRGKLVDFDIAGNTICGVLLDGDSSDNVELYQPDQFKLTLRPIISMTEDECKQMLCIIWEHELIEAKYRYQPYDKSHYEDAAEYQLLDFYSIINTKKERFFFTIYHDFAFTLGWIKEKGHTSVTPARNHHFVTKYLIEKGFDVFELIKAGLAIDVNILTEE